MFPLSFFPTIYYFLQCFKPFKKLQSIRSGRLAGGVKSDYIATLVLQGQVLQYFFVFFISQSKIWQSSQILFNLFTKSFTLPQIYEYTAMCQTISRGPNPNPSLQFEMCAYFKIVWQMFQFNLNSILDIQKRLHSSDVRNRICKRILPFTGTKTGINH